MLREAKLIKLFTDVIYGFSSKSKAGTYVSQARGLP